MFFTSIDHAEKFKECLLFKHSNINFSLKKEIDGRSSFLDNNIFPEIGKIETFNHYRPSVVYTLISTSANLTPIKLEKLSHAILIFQFMLGCFEILSVHHYIKKYFP